MSRRHRAERVVNPEGNTKWGDANFEDATANRTALNFWNVVRGWHVVMVTACALGHLEQPVFLDDSHVHLAKLPLLSVTAAVTLNHEQVLGVGLTVHALAGHRVEELLRQLQQTPHTADVITGRN